MNKSLFVFAGEQSGDLLGGALLQALGKQFDVWGVGGSLMREAGLHPLLPMEEFRVMGFIDVFKALPRLYRHFKTVRNAILQENPDGVVLIDYPGFNLRLAKALRKHGYEGKIIHYVAPTVWAHGKKRIQTLAKHTDLLLTLYPFEAELWSGTDLAVVYVGDPLVEKVTDHQHCPLAKERYLALFPGSRPSEIQLNLPIMLEVTDKLESDLPLAISLAHESLRPLIQRTLKGRVAELIPANRAYDLMASSHAALATSGTVTRELALHRVPTLVVYKLSLLSLFFARFVLRLKLPFYCMVNIIMQREIFPEFMHYSLDTQAITTKLSQLLPEGKARSKLLADCEEYANQIKGERSSQKAAQAIVETLVLETPQSPTP